MFYKNIEKMFDACYEELVCSENNEIQGCIKKIRKIIPGDDETFMKEFIKMSICDIFFNELSEEDSNKLLIKRLNDAVYHLGDIKKSIVLKVGLKYQEEKINRIIEIPYTFSLADMAYAILGTFQAEAEHLYLIEHKRIQYGCHQADNDYDEQCAQEVFLPTLKLRKNSKMELCYDFGDNYLFSISVVEINTHKDIFTLEQMRVIDGKGYGIWEDEHYALDLYLDHPKEFYDYVHEQGLELDFYDLDSEFDLEESNNEFLDSYFSMKGVYE